MKRLALCAAVAASLLGAQAVHAAAPPPPPSLTVPAGYTATPLAVDGQVERFTGGLSLGFDAAGNLLVGTFPSAGCNTNGGALYRINADGSSSVVESTTSGLLTPISMRLGPGGVWGGQLYVVDSNAGTDCGGKVFRLEADGSLTTITDHSQPPLAYEPRGIAFGPPGSFGVGALYIVESTTSPNPFTEPNSGTIERVGAPGQFPQIVATGGPLGDPSSIAFGPGGAYGTDLYIGDPGEAAAGGPAPSIERMDAAGNVTVFADGSRFADGTFRPFKFTFAPPGPFGGLLYATNNPTQQIVTVDPSGNVAAFATLVNSTGSFDDVVASPDGRHLYVLVMDGFPGPSEIFRIDANVPPAPTLTAPSDGALFGTSSVAFAGSADVNALVHVLVDGVEATSVTTDASGAFAGTLTLADGSHSIAATQEENAVVGPASAAVHVFVDTVVPTVACGTADGLWHADNVTIACSASDGGSGLANTADASFGLSTSVPAGSETANALTNTHDVCDLAGNCTTAGPIGGNMVDRAAPVLHLPAPITTSSTTVFYSVTATDGTDPAPSVVCTPPSGSTFAVGTTTVQCTATDHAGNTASGSFTVTVTDPMTQLVNAAGVLGRAKLKAHVRNLALVGAPAYCTQLKVIANELAAIDPATLTAQQQAALAAAKDAVAALQAANGCSG